jgi:hypothetical protein
MTDYTSEINRRKFKRVQANILCRSAPFSLSRKLVQDIGIGGLRVCSDENQKIGKKLEIELFPAGRKSFCCTVKVIWVNKLPDDAAATYEIGLQFLKVHDQDLMILNSIIADRD